MFSFCRMESYCYQYDGRSNIQTHSCLKTVTLSVKKPCQNMQLSGVDCIIHNTLGLFWMGRHNHIIVNSATEDVVYYNES